MSGRRWGWRSLSALLSWIVNPGPKHGSAPWPWFSEMSLQVHNLKGHFYSLSLLHFAHITIHIFSASQDSTSLPKQDFAFKKKWWIFINKLHGRKMEDCKKIKKVKRRRDERSKKKRRKRDAGKWWHYEYTLCSKLSDLNLHILGNVEVSQMFCMTRTIISMRKSRVKQIKGSSQIDKTCKRHRQDSNPEVFNSRSSGISAVLQPQGNCIYMEGVITWTICNQEDKCLPQMFHRFLYLKSRYGLWPFSAPWTCGKSRAPFTVLLQWWGSSK